MAAALAIALLALVLDEFAGSEYDLVSLLANEAPTTTPLSVSEPSTSALLLSPEIKPPTELKEARLPKPMSLVCMESKLIFMVSPALVPVCNWMLPAEPSNRLMPLRLVLIAMSWICALI